MFVLMLKFKRLRITYSLLVMSLMIPIRIKLLRLSENLGRTRNLGRLRRLMTRRLSLSKRVTPQMWNRVSLMVLVADTGSASSSRLSDLLKRPKSRGASPQAWVSSPPKTLRSPNLNPRSNSKEISLGARKGNTPWARWSSTLTKVPTWILLEPNLAQTSTWTCNKKVRRWWTPTGFPHSWRIATRKSTWATRGRCSRVRCLLSTS